MVRCAALFIILASATFVRAQGGNYSIKKTENPPPKEISPDIGKLLNPWSVRLLDKQGKALAEIWFRKQVPADATPEQVKNGLTYRELKQTEILGAVRFEQDWTDYRKQKVKAGVYTLRLGYQPADGDHTGSADYNEFLVAIAAAKDTKPGLLEPKEMIEKSQQSIDTGHPAVFMLFPNPKPAAEPQLRNKVSKLFRNIPHWVIDAREEITVSGKKAGTIGIGLTLVGHAG